MKIRLTKWECEFLCHRLGTPDCIGEAVGSALAEEGDDYDSEYKKYSSEIEDIASRFYEQICDTQSFDIDITNELELETIADAVDGNTWFANSKDYCSPQKIGSHIKALKKLIDKLQANGIDTEPPFIE